jgi:hypothetical protein
MPQWYKRCLFLWACTGLPVLLLIVFYLFYAGGFASGGEVDLSYYSNSSFIEISAVVMFMAGSLFGLGFPIFLFPVALWSKWRRSRREDTPG